VPQPAVLPHRLLIYPRLIEFRDSLPMTATGKILKRELRDEEIAKQQGG
jgi:acyl-CoA synthetase (AMP-forming)/AMP-acid ligase II